MEISISSSALQNFRLQILTQFAGRLRAKHQLLPSLGYSGALA